MAIRILITGGTFDKEYNELDGSLLFNDTHLPEMLRRGRSMLEVKARTIMLVDSLDLTDDDRETIYEHCKASQEDRILITHGTDTMEVTARYLGERINDKAIVLTGAMVPYIFGSSDGMFNLGAALAFVQTLPHGVYIAMNGKYFAYDNVRKNKSTGTFEEIR
ncbi:asparaginase [Candidatus Acetothermia bacterium]|nr:asparaginase [Candidatus Acetothermia bacterium]MBI3642818.1 asparaginase [Candidatus Acetothermia bacterium]